MKVKCKTKFDITPTGVIGRFRQHALPFVDKSGRTISSIDVWNYARNQQRNFETLIQLISLRTQPMDLSNPVKKDSCYEFTFQVETENVFYDGKDDLALLRQDCEGVPMLIKLDEKDNLDPVLHSQEPNANIWFEKID